MNRKLKLLGLTLGDPFNPSSRSGVNYNVFSRISKQCELIDVFDLDLRGVRKFLSAVVNVSFSRRTWANKLHQNPWAFNVRTQMAEQILNNFAFDIDLIYQDGAMFMPGRKPTKPFVSYHDSNVLLSAHGGPYAQGAHYKGKGYYKTIAQERTVYENAKLIFAMSNWLKQSLVRDFHIPEEKIITVYAGTNVEPEEFEKHYDGKTIVFIGRNFERKGGKTLLDAFKLVKKEIKGARLIIIGPHLTLQEEGIYLLGSINDRRELANHLKQASIFVLPSLYEPFGIVFAEAFAYRNPCIGTNTCAMPEIIEEGKGGFLVSPNDHKSLAERMIELLKDEKLAAEMGKYGFEKVRKVFNWDVVVGKMISHCYRISHD